MKRSITEIFGKDILIFPFGIFLSLILISLDSLGGVSFIRDGISYVANPIYVAANLTGKEIGSYWEIFKDFGAFREECDSLVGACNEQTVQNSYFTMLVEENEALRKQVNLTNLEQKYVLAKVLSSDSVEFLRINEGKSSGIVIGDIVVLGNLYLGNIVRVDEKSSLVRLPRSKNNNLEVVVVDGDWQEVKSNKKVSILSKAVVSGTADGIKIENISANSKVQNGDLVVVNDSKVGESLVLGYIVNLSSNPAETSKSGVVVPVMDYDDLLTVFVRVSR
jgi:cell shape-determining protein MreC